MSKYIRDMRHSVEKGWHRYDFLLTEVYRWDEILSSAQYLMDMDIQGMQTVRCTYEENGTPCELTEQVKAAGGLLKCPEAQKKGSSLSVGGVSKYLNCIVMVNWTNLSSVFSVYTMEKDVNDQIKDYVDKLLALAFEEVSVEEPKKKYGMKEWVVNSVIGLSVVAIILSSVMVDFTNFGVWLVSLVIACVLLLLGIMIKYQISHPKDNQVYLLVSSERPFRPYMDEKGRAYLFTGMEKSRKYIEKHVLTSVKIVQHKMDEELFDMFMCTNGFEGVVKDGRFKKNERYLGNRLEAIVYQFMQRLGFPEVVRKELLTDEEFNDLQHALNELPLFTAFVYEDENPMEQRIDGVLHMTEEAQKLFGALQEKGQYYAMNQLCPGKEIVELKQGNRIVYYGDRDTSSTQSNGKLMHPRVADNTRDKTKALTGYTNLATLKSFFERTRVALFTFEELAQQIDETDGFMLNLGRAGIGAMFDKELVKELVKKG